MTSFSFPRLGALAGAAAVMLLSVAPERAAAQGFFESVFGNHAGVGAAVFSQPSGPGGFSRPQGRTTVPFSTRYRQGTIVVSFSDRRLYFIHRPGEAISYPIGVPTGNARWSGTYPVSMKRVNPPWTPTASMRRENPELPVHVPGGHPQNPMGVRALYLGDTLYRIHGTDAPWTIGNEVSRGCIRLYNEDVIDLYDRVRIGARVIVTWDRFRT